jgi:plasmid stabilization system protein ParE
MAALIRWSPKAIFNLEDICNYIAKDSQINAVNIAKKIVSQIEKIPIFPKSGRIVPEFNNEIFRELFFNNYRIIYCIKKEVIKLLLFVMAQDY